MALAGLLASGAARADTASPALEQLAATIAARLAAHCPPAAKDAVAARDVCAAGLRDADFIPFARDGVAFGGDQPGVRMAKKQLTHLNPRVFRSLYLSLFTFTGRWSVAIDPLDKTGVIRIEGYFRNALPAGEFPYPFWHSAAKWADREAANEIEFYLNRDGTIFAATRSNAGSETDRGAYAHVVPPVFDGNWLWADTAGQTQPRVSLFASRYRTGNPNLANLDATYRAFAVEARRGACIDCHAPDNEAGMKRLVLLQTPMHASGEIDAVLKAVAAGEMPQDDLGLRKEIPPLLRAAILKTGEAFRQALHEADKWETGEPQ